MISEGLSGETKHKLSNSITRTVVILRLMKRFAMDSIWNCAFSIDNQIQTNNEKFFILNKSDEAIESLLSYSLTLYLPGILIKKKINFKLRFNSLNSKYYSIVS